MLKGYSDIFWPYACTIRKIQTVAVRATDEPYLEIFLEQGHLAPLETFLITSFLGVFLDLCGGCRPVTCDCKGTQWRAIAPRAPTGWKTIRSKGEKVTLEDDVSEAPWQWTDSSSSHLWHRLNDTKGHQGPQWSICSPYGRFVECEPSDIPLSAFKTPLMLELSHHVTPCHMSHSHTSVMS